LGEEVRVDDNAVIGKSPIRSTISATTTEKRLPPCDIGDRALIGTSAVVYRGAVIGAGVLVADLATVREDVKIGRGTIVGRGVAIENSCTIGEFCKLETNAYVAAFSVVEDRCFLSPSVVTTNDNFVGRTRERLKLFKGLILRKGARIGANATILPGREIGEDALVAAGAVVTRDLQPRKIYVGVPARPLRDVPKSQLLENQEAPMPPRKE
jgi:acetyltransferase-like isoleucine patch superfamily enzyme